MAAFGFTVFMVNSSSMLSRPGDYTFDISDWMSCYPNPAVLQVNICQTTIFVTYGQATAKITAQMAPWPTC